MEQEPDAGSGKAEECGECAEEKRGGVRRLVSGIASGDSAFAAERKLLLYSISSFFLLLAFHVIGFLGVFGSARQSWGRLAPLLVLTDVGVVACVSALSHYRSFGKGFSHMTGMMIGMTLGMVPGFMAGALVGAANGMFVGSVAGMLVGMTAGAWAGKCCGVMGVMEGLMAGIMAGTMGAMLSVMMVNDHLVPFLYILFVSCVLVLAGLAYALFKEGGCLKQERFGTSFLGFFSVSFITATAVTLLMLYGPRFGLVWLS